MVGGAEWSVIFIIAYEQSIYKEYSKISNYVVERMSDLIIENIAKFVMCYGANEQSNYREILQNLYVLWSK